MRPVLRADAALFGFWPASLSRHGGSSRDPIARPYSSPGVTGFLGAQNGAPAVPPEPSALSGVGEATSNRTGWPMQKTVFTPLVLAMLAALCGPAAAGVLVSVDKSTQRMSVVVDGKQRYSWPVSTGARGYETPAGSFRPFRMEEDHFSREWDEAPMPHSIFFTSAGHAIHGSNATRRLGSPASHGCVRLAPANAAKLFALVQAEGMGNTKVIVGGGERTAAVRRAAAPARQVRFERRSTSDPRTRMLVDDDGAYQGNTAGWW
jgi:lipoprotein-anchoring transpeptidase ErfK/SrfK